MIASAASLPMPTLLVGKVRLGAGQSATVQLRRVSNGREYALANMEDVASAYRVSRRDGLAPASRWLRAALACDGQPRVRVEPGGRFGAAWALVPLVDAYESLPAVPMEPAEQ